MSYYIPTGGAPVGLNPSTTDIVVHLDSGAAAQVAGALVQLDHLGAGTDTPAADIALFNVGVSASAFANAIVPATFITGHYAVLTEDVSPGGTAAARVLGTVTAVGGTGGIPANGYLGASADGLAAVGATEKTIGISGPAIAATATGQVWVDTITGLGNAA